MRFSFGFMLMVMSLINGASGDHNLKVNVNKIFNLAF